LVGRNGKKSGNGESIAAAVTEVSERVSLLVREEFELAKAEVTQKVASIAKGTVAVAAGGVFGIFALIFALLTLAWGLDAILVSGAGDIWIGFAIVFGILSVLALASFLFAWRKLKVGAPKPDMAIVEAKKIRETVAVKAAEKPAAPAPPAVPVSPAVPVQAAVTPGGAAHTIPASPPALAHQGAPAEQAAPADQAHQAAPADQAAPATPGDPTESAQNGQPGEKA
jgi:uncharacterized small protein (DUF1192 family)